MSSEVLEVIKNNPGLPVYAYVDSEVVGDDQAPFSWLGRVTSARVQKIAFVEPYGYYDKTIVEIDDTDDYEEYLIDDAPMNITDEDLNNYVKKKVSELPFEEVILLYVSTI